MFSWLAYNTLCALPLLILALLARRLARATPAVEHLLLLLVLLRLVLPPLAPGTTVPAAPASAIVASGAPGLGERAVAAVTRVLGNDWSTWAERVLVLVFLATLTWVVARELWRARGVERCVARARGAGDELRRHVDRVAAGLGVRAPRLRVSSEASGPFLWSLRRPVLVLPAEAGLPAPTVLAHEFAHLRRRDHWTAWLELLVQGFHFWNPLFWFVRARLHRAAELACDRWVVERFPAERRAFATALVDTAERASQGTFVPRAVQAIGMDRRDFEERLVCILRADPGQHGGRWLLAGGILCAALTLPGVAAPSLGAFRRGLPELPAGIDEGVWQRSLAAAETALAANSADGAAEKRRGIALLGLGRAREALASFERQEALGLEPAKALYNQACAWVRLDELAAALDCLARAAELGLDVPGYAEQDPDLEPLRSHPGFAALRR